MTKSCDYSVVAVAAAAAAFLFLHCAAAQTLRVVGDTKGWTVPSTTDFYTTWTSSKTFHLNDTLSFEFPTNEHDVVKVPKESYDACTSNNQIGKTVSTGPYNFTLTDAGTHYFICSIGQHCARGQKLAVTVVSGSSTSPEGAPSPSSTTQPPPPGSSAAPPALAGFFLIMLCFALGKLVI